MAEEPQKPGINQKPYFITEIINDTPDIRVFRFKAQDGSTLDFDPGMFMMLTYLDSSTNGRITRAFSIASAPKTETIDFYIHLVHGQLTSKLENAKVGDIYYMSGPHGQFRFVAAQDRKVLFVAGGTGIAPFISMLKQIEMLKLDLDIVMLYSVRFPNEIIRKDELYSLGKSVNMRMTVTVTRPQESDGWNGETGHINPDMIKKYAADFAERTAYVCGPLPFVKAIKDALAALGVDSSRVKADVWG